MEPPVTHLLYAVTVHTDFMLYLLHVGYTVQRCPDTVCVHVDYTVQHCPDTVYVHVGYTVQRCPDTVCVHVQTSDHRPALLGIHV